LAQLQTGKLNLTHYLVLSCFYNDQNTDWIGHTDMTRLCTQYKEKLVCEYFFGKKKSKLTPYVIYI
jgi:hypothetical protein